LNEQMLTAKENKMGNDSFIEKEDRLSLAIY
jgi:hypothetical protein